MRIEPFKAHHLDLIVIQENQEDWLKALTWADKKAMEGPYAYTAIEGDRILAVGGIQEIWKDRAVVWAYLAADLGIQMLALHRAVMRGMALWPQKRIESYVEVDFEAGHRWAKMLGFEVETPIMKKGLPNGKDCSVYVRIQ